MGLVIAFEGVLDTASAGDWDFSKPWFTMRSHLRFTVYVQGEQLGNSPNNNLPRWPLNQGAKGLSLGGKEKGELGVLGRTSCP